jgi:chromosome segregation ATPase
MLLGLTEFTKIYLQIKNNPWPYVNLARLVHNAKMGDGEVVELLKITNGYLPRVRLEYDRLNEEKSSLEAEISSRRAELNNIARTYQQFCDRNLELKKREDELQYSINELEAKESELQRTISGLKQQLSEH